MLLEMHEFAFQAERFQLTMRCEQQCSARSFITSARLDADKAVLYEINAANRVAPANLIEQFNQRHRAELLSIHRDRSARLKANGHALLAIRRLLRRARKLPR